MKNERFRERMKKLFMDMGDFIDKTDSNPVHIAAFPHQYRCSKSLSLKRIIIGSYSVFAPGPTDHIEGIYLSCPECGVTKKV